MSDKKSINKSIRISPKIYNYIDSHPGNGFNEKLENIILESMEFETARLKRIAELDDLIQDKAAQYELLKSKIISLNDFLLVAVRANSMLKELDKLVKQIVSQKN